MIDSNKQRAKLKSLSFAPSGQSQMRYTAPPPPPCQALIDIFLPDGVACHRLRPRYHAPLRNRATANSQNRRPSNMPPPKPPKKATPTIALNKRARYDYHLEDRFEAGIALHGWEVKSARQGKVQLTDTYVLFQKGEAWLFGSHIAPLPSAGSHLPTDPARTRKLLLHRRELSKLIGASERKGYTIVCTAMYWKAHLIKVEIALAKGKQQHDKRQTIKERDWSRQKQRLQRNR